VEAGGLFAWHTHPPNPACPVGCNIQAALLPTLNAAEAAMQETLARTTIAELLLRLQSSWQGPGPGGLAGRSLSHLGRRGEDSEPREDRPRPPRRPDRSAR
jgi:hypothetical protein